VYLSEIRSEAAWNAYEFECWRAAVLERGLKVSSLDWPMKVTVSASLRERRAPSAQGDLGDAMCPNI
jgi:hypothetical protein